LFALRDAESNKLQSIIDTCCRVWPENQATRAPPVQRPTLACRCAG
jgi:hypothetical protein